MRRPRRIRLAAMIAVLGAAGCLAGCSDDPVSPEPQPPVESPYPFPYSEDQLMKNFRSAYEALDAAGLVQMLRDDSVTILQPDTQRLYSELGTTLDHAEEARCAARMLGGEEVTDPDGVHLPAISSISFQTFEQQGQWYTTSAADVIVGVRAAMFDVTFLYARPGYSTLKTDGQIRFYAASRDSMYQGIVRSYWQLVGQQDLTESGPVKATESVAWGTVKALYR